MHQWTGLSIILIDLYLVITNPREVVCSVLCLAPGEAARRAQSPRQSRRSCCCCCCWGSAATTDSFGQIDIACSKGKHGEENWVCVESTCVVSYMVILRPVPCHYKARVSSHGVGTEIGQDDDDDLGPLTSSWNTLYYPYLIDNLWSRLEYCYVWAFIKCTPELKPPY